MEGHILPGGLQQVFFLNHMFNPSSKSLDVHLEPQMKYPKFQPKIPKSG